MFLLVASLKTLGVKASAATGMTTRLTALTTTHRVIHRVHNDTTVVGATAEPTAATSLTRLLKGMVGIADNANSSTTRKKHLASFT